MKIIKHTGPGRIKGWISKKEILKNCNGNSFLLKYAVYLRTYVFVIPGEQFGYVEMKT